jgi:hypothetical protein
MKYGLSLSFCVRAIIDREITLFEIAGIISATKMESPEEAYEQYGKSYWSEASEDDVMVVLRELWPRVIQPRMYGLPHHNISKGIWLEVAHDRLPVLIEARHCAYWMEGTGNEPAIGMIRNGGLWKFLA